MHCDTIVLGAGIVGVSTALQLQARGRSVVLLDRAQPGSGTLSQPACRRADSGQKSVRLTS